MRWKKKRKKKQRVVESAENNKGLTTLAWARKRRERVGSVALGPSVQSCLAVLWFFFCRKKIPSNTTHPTPALEEPQVTQPYARLVPSSGRRQKKPNTNSTHPGIKNRQQPGGSLSARGEGERGEDANANRNSQSHGGTRKEPAPILYLEI